MTRGSRVAVFLPPRFTKVLTDTTLFVGDALEFEYGAVDQFGEADQLTFALVGFSEGSISPAGVYSYNATFLGDFRVDVSVSDRNNQTAITGATITVIAPPNDVSDAF